MSYAIKTKKGVDYIRQIKLKYYPIMLQYVHQGQFLENRAQPRLSSWIQNQLQKEVTALGAAECWALVGACPSRMPVWSVWHTPFHLDVCTGEEVTGGGSASTTVFLRGTEKGAGRGSTELSACAACVLEWTSTNDPIPIIKKRKKKKPLWFSKELTGSCKCGFMTEQCHNSSADVRTWSCWEVFLQPACNDVS